MDSACLLRFLVVVDIQKFRLCVVKNRHINFTWFPVLNVLKMYDKNGSLGATSTGCLVTYRFRTQRGEM